MQVLETESLNMKAFFRRAQAYSALMDLELAEQDLKKVLEIDPENRFLRFSQSLKYSQMYAVTIKLSHNFKLPPSVSEYANMSM